MYRFGVLRSSRFSSIQGALIYTLVVDDLQAHDVPACNARTSLLQVLNLHTAVVMEHLNPTDFTFLRGRALTEHLDP